MSEIENVSENEKSYKGKYFDINQLLEHVEPILAKYFDINQ